MTTENLLRVTRISVEGLFERYSHNVPLHLDERVTIIHGPNGVGKTALLKLTAALLTGRMTEFAKAPFKTFEVSLSDDTIFGVRREEQVTTKTGKKDTLTFYLQKPGSAPEEWVIQQDPAEILRQAIRIENGVPYLVRWGPEEFVDRRTEEVITALEVVARFSDQIPDAIKRRGGIPAPEPEWIKGIQKSVGIHFVEAQRLLRFTANKETDYHFPGSSQPRYIETVKDYARDLQRRISETLTNYAKVSQSLDQSFPERLLKGRNSWETLPINALMDRMQELEARRVKLKQLGLIEQDAAYPFDVSALENAADSERTVMTLYVEDTAKKLGVLGSLARRIDLMTDNINKKFQHKRLRVSRDKGFEAVNSYGMPLELAALSSGEQHELVLLYDLLFRVQSNTLVLIDEPELSLHVTWQKSFLPDLLEIVAATEFDVLLATHSPFIVGDRSDLMTPLLADADNNQQ